MSKLFEIIGIKTTAHTTSEEMVESMMGAAQEQMDEMFPEGPEDSLLNFECKVFHDDGCPSVKARDFAICKCRNLRMEVYLITMDEAVLKLATGAIIPHSMVLRSDPDEEPTGDLN